MMQNSVIAQENHRVAWVSAFKRLADNHVTRLNALRINHEKPLHTADYPAKAPRPHYSVLDKTKIKDTFGIEIPHWEESLKRCINQLRMETL